MLIGLDKMTAIEVSDMERLLELVVIAMALGIGFYVILAVGCLLMNSWFWDKEGYMKGGDKSAQGCSCIVAVFLLSLGVLIFLRSCA